MTSSTPSLPSPSAANREQARRRLERALGMSKVMSDPDACTSYMTDDSGAPGQLPDAVVLATTTSDIQKTLAIAAHTGVPVTPRAAGTGRTGGATCIAGGIVLATQGMNQIVDIDREEGVIVVEPGVVLADLQRAVEAEGWFYPPDPNSASMCTLGGNVAENAAGPRALKYGPTRDYVLGMAAFLMGGQALQVGRRTKKGVTGYDMTALLVGSEGTLGVLGNLTLQLIPKPESVLTLGLQFATLEAAVTAVSSLLRQGILPRCAELLDDVTLDLLRQAGNPLDGRAQALLMVEVDGSESACAQQAARISASCEGPETLEVLVAQSENQRARLWDARKQMSYAIRRLARHKISEDVVVPRRKLTALVSGVRTIGERLQVRVSSYGHAGDGNLHVNFLWNTPDEKRNVDQAIVELFQLTISLGGTLSGEHGIGVLKAPYLPLEQSPELMALQRDVKRVFDPAGLLNPGKIFPSQHRAC